MEFIKSLNTWIFAFEYIENYSLSRHSCSILLWLWLGRVCFWSLSCIPQAAASIHHYDDHTASCHRWSPLECKDCFSGYRCRTSQRRDPFRSICLSFRTRLLLLLVFGWTRYPVHKIIKEKTICILSYFLQFFRARALTTQLFGWLKKKNLCYHSRGVFHKTTKLNLSLSWT